MFVRTTHELIKLLPVRAQVNNSDSATHVCWARMVKQVGGGWWGLEMFYCWRRKLQINKARTIHTVIH